MTIPASVDLDDTAVKDNPGASQEDPDIDTIKVKSDNSSRYKHDTQQIKSEGDSMPTNPVKAPAETGSQEQRVDKGDKTSGDKDEEDKDNRDNNDGKGGDDEETNNILVCLSTLSSARQRQKINCTRDLTRLALRLIMSRRTKLQLKREYGLDILAPTIQCLRKRSLGSQTQSKLIEARLTGNHTNSKSPNYLWVCYSTKCGADKLVRMSTQQHFCLIDSKYQKGIFIVAKDSTAKCF